ncbi:MULTISPECIES: glutathione S-transferase family protein [unclassified Pseudomonas]|uniref:glutathione S-transferase family protein n=1 Tax=unclassified Pseudomonas TaxID=196821 RepID=UPI00215F1536|nr:MULTISPECIES: glutathione S-transferase family protein [unclassified Pseudomonas]UVM48305.1 glutathione S-transferase family protein [Pseudomonas sp. B21-015]WPN55972.1 glutathione S-transferase family protein [Pseudomonas sp. P9_31]
MKLVGMMGSPYVRRVAISLRLMGVEHEHRQISVFRDADEFRAINSVVKAPTLICDNGEMIMDSSMILDYLESLVEPKHSLMPKDSRQHQKVLSLIGLGLAVCEKAVQLEYEHNKPVEYHYEPWLTRIAEQLHAALALLEEAAVRANPWLATAQVSQADVTVAAAWRFTQFRVSNLVDVKSYTALAAYSDQIEQLPEFVDTPLK